MNKIVVLSSFLLAVPFASSCNKNIYKITINGTHIASYTLSDQQATRGKDFTVKFTAEKYYRLGIEGIKEVSVKGEPFPQDFGWTFSEETSTLKVKGEIVTGNVDITVEAKYLPFFITIYPNGWPTDKTLEAGGYFVAEVDQSYTNAVITVKEPSFKAENIASPQGLNCKVVEDGNDRKLYIDRTEFYRDFDVRFTQKQ